MPDPRLSVHDRVQALQRLEAIAFELNEAAAYLAANDIETESDQLEQSARNVLAVCWLLSRPLCPQLPASRWQAH